MEATMSWAEKAEQRGPQQGLRQGMLAVITKQIEHRFGQVDSETRDRLSELSSDQLQILGDVLLDFSHVEDLVNGCNPNKGRYNSRKTLHFRLAQLLMVPDWKQRLQL